jgi:hypothetical protein
VSDSSGNIHYTEHNQKKSSLNNRDSLPENGQVGYKSPHCPYSLAFKSILLSRSETKYIGEPLNAKVNSLVIRNKLANLEVRTVLEA